MRLKLVPIWSTEHPTLRVNDSGSPTRVGRNPDCRILDRKCSRSQVIINFDRDLQTFMVEQRGIHGSMLNGQLIGRGKRRAVQPGDMLQVLAKAGQQGDFVYDVAMDEGDVIARHIDQNNGTVGGSKSSVISPSKSTVNGCRFSEDTLDLDETEATEGGEELDVAARLDAMKTQAEAYFEDKMDTSEQPSSSTSTPVPPARTKKLLGQKATTSTNSKPEVSSTTDKKPTLSIAVPQNRFVGWHQTGDLFMWHTMGVEHRSKVAAFDLDWTIIGTKAGNTFPKSWEDWKILYPEVPKRLREIHRSGYKVVFFTNQKRHGQADNIGLFRKKLEAIAEILPCPIQIYGSAGGTYRKPLPGMWNYMRDYCNGGLELDLEACYYVGDAAGREVSAIRKKKDFSCSDRLFALNVGIKFLTPEQFFLNKPSVESFKMPEFDPIAAVASPPEHLMDPPDTKLRLGNGPEIVVLVGYPATGKSTFAKTHLRPLGFEVVNLDTMRTKTAKACLTAAKTALEAGKPVVIDNTNYDAAVRAPFLALAAAHRVPCRCFQMPKNLALALHLNRYRLMQGPDERHRGVTDATLAMLKNKFVEPTEGEGFSAMVKINFIPEFGEKDDKTLFAMHFG